MKDRLKFRVWDNVFEEFVTERMELRPDGSLIIEYPEAASNGGLLYVDATKEPKRYIIEQCTGFRDATKWENVTEAEQKDWLRNHKKEDWNGKLIFEGDRLRIFDGYNGDSEYITTVFQRDNVLCIEVRGYDWDYTALGWTSEVEECEIIDNIHEVK